MQLSSLTFFVKTYGCQMNEHDAERIAGLLESTGAVPVRSFEQADIVVFMTCCVRERADERLYGQAASIKNLPLRPGSPVKKRLIAIGGCIGQRDAESLVEKLSHIDVVFGTHNLSELPALLVESMESGSSAVHTVDESDGFATDLPQDRATPWAAWLPITTGCDNFCTYCIVPYVRGREKSRPLDEISDEAGRLVADGVREITLLGQNVNSYGRDLYGEASFDRVLDAVSQSGVERIRFATSHPKDLTDDVIERFAMLPNLMPALHLPVQSGSNRILDAMNRRYTREHYLELVGKVRAAVPDIALSTDIIVGFPGETEEDFQATYNLVESVGYHQVFTFIYSKREGTPAAKLKDDTPKEVVQRRFDSLVELVQKKAYELNQPFVGRTMPVLVEGVSPRDDSMLSGRSPFNQTVHFPRSSEGNAMSGRIVDVRIDTAKTWYLQGTSVLQDDGGLPH